MIKQGRLVAAATAFLIIAANPGVTAAESLMTPDEIKNAWIGKKLLGRTPTGVMFDFTMRTDGTAEIVGINWSDVGTWRFSKNGYCTKWNRIREGQERCVTVVKNGSTSTVFNPDKSVSAEILRTIE